MKIIRFIYYLIHYRVYKMGQHIVLIGPRCVGKTNTGVSLAEALNAEFIDADPLIETRAGKPINEIVECHGWQYFRQLETDLIKEITSNGAGRRIVFAPGGGAVAHEYNSLREQNIQYLRSFGKVILLMPSENLEESARIIYKRMMKDKKSSTQRPSLTGLPPQEEILNILIKRIPLYMRAQDCTIYTTGSSEIEVARKVIHELEKY